MLRLCVAPQVLRLLVLMNKLKLSDIQAKLSRVSDTL